MVTAIVLVKADRKRLSQVIEALPEIPGVMETYTVTGPHDFVVVVRGESNEAIATVVTERLTAIEGITDTLTMMALRCYSKHALDAGFQL